MALDRFRKLAPERQRAVLETAARWFSRHGYAGTSYNELLAELGFGKSQAYYYFADKADLFLTAVGASYELYYEAAQRIPLPKTADEFWSYVYELNLLGFRFQAEHPIAAGLTRAALEGEIRSKIADFLLTPGSSSREQHSDWIALGQALGAVRSDLDSPLLVRLSLDLAQFVDFYFAERASSAGPEERERLAHVFTDLARRVFSPGPTAL